jgi:2-methylcitrate dehydratase PrpD
MAPKSISRVLGEFLVNLSYVDLPPEVVDRTKCLILDALACGIAGCESAYRKIALKLVRNNSGQATVFTTGLTLRAVDAAFVNAILVNSIGQDDMLYVSHPGTVIIPAAFAVSEEEGSSGSEVITAIVAGYDVLGRIFLGGPAIVPRFRGVSVFGPFGSAAASGKLLKLNEDEMTSALGYAANFASGFAECWVAGTMEAKFHVGMASRNGVMAAELAKAGAKAAETSLEGKSGFYQAFAGTTAMADAATTDLGKRFLIMEAEVKSYPVCGLQQVPVELALTLMKQHDIKGKDVIRIIETMPESEYLYPGTNYAGPFTTRFQAIMSAQYCAAATFLGKPIASPSFYDRCYNDPGVGELARKVELVGVKGRSKTRIEVVLRDGRQYGIEDNGSEMLVPTIEKIKMKFENLTYDFLGKEKSGRIIDAVLTLEKLDNISKLTQILNSNEIDRG